MTRLARMVSAAIVLLVASSFGSVVSATSYGPTPASKDLRSIVESDPRIGDALLESFAAADWGGIDTMDEFYEYIDETERRVPYVKTLLEEIRPFFYLVGHSEYFENSKVFQEWIKRFVSSYGTFLDTTASVAGLQTFFDDPAFKIDDYYVAPSGWLTFNQFFARQVKPGKRPIEGLGDHSTIVAPADGVFRGQFPVSDDATISVKGIDYSIADLLKGSKFADAFDGGTFVHSYQRITDYHRFHVPFAGEVVEKKNISGYVWLDLEKGEDGSFVSVDRTGFQWRQERGIIVVSTEDIGLIAIVPVGMGLVGDVVLMPDVGAKLHKGEEFGFFQFGGSDVIMIFQKDMVEVTAEVGQHYLQGQKIGMRKATH
jgi:phosphatidylserine decarboxylase